MRTPHFFTLRDWLFLVKRCLLVAEHFTPYNEGNNSKAKNEDYFVRKGGVLKSENFLLK